MRLLSSGTITVAIPAGLSGVGTVHGRVLPDTLSIEATFVDGTGGTSVDAYVQTSFDGGGTWADIAEFSFANTAVKKMVNLSRSTAVTSIATPTDGSLSANTCVDGFLGSQYRVKYVTLGTYSGGTSLTIDIAAAGARIE